MLFGNVCHRVAEGEQVVYIAVPLCVVSDRAPLSQNAGNNARPLPETPRALLTTQMFGQERLRESSRAVYLIWLRQVLPPKSVQILRTL